MNKVKFLVAALLGVLFVACSEEENLSQTSKTGFLVSLTEDVKVDSRKTPEELGKPAASQFKLKITNQTTGSELYSGSYTEDLIPASAGMYEIEATYGDNPVLALDAPYYKGTAEADLADGESKTVQVNCKVANALASVVFDNSGTNTFESQFVSYGVRVSVNTSVTTLTNDGKSAYYRAGSMPVFTFVGTLRNGGGVKEVPLENSNLSSPSTFAAGKHCRITLKLSDAAPGLRVEISKVEVDSVTINETIPLEWLPKPKVEATGFDNNNTLAFVETEAVTPKLDFVLSSALQDMKLKFDFEDEQFASLDKEKEYLLSNAADKAAIEEALGILLPNVGDTQANIDLSALTDKLHTNNGTATTNAITVDVQANNRWSSEDESANLTYTLVCNKPEFSVAVQPGNCWSREFTIDEVQVTGNADVEKIKANLVYQYYNGIGWVNCTTRDNVTGRTQQFSSTAEEIAEKTYKVRALYRGAIASNEVEATLETPEQLPNGNMDQWSYETYTGNRYSFNPWSDGGASFWDTNNDYTTRHRHNSSSATMANYNGFHAVSYVAGRSGLAAELRSTANGRGNTRVDFIIHTHNELEINKVAGKLFAGTANVEMTGNDISGSDTYTEEKNAAFSSRPTALQFYCKYAPYNTDSWSVHIELLDENKNVIVQNDKTSSETKNDWTQESVSLDYANGTTYAKCKYIYVIFKSTINEGADMPYREITQTFYILENGSLSAHTYEPAYVGSVLTIDDIELVYDK